MTGGIGQHADIPLELKFAQGGGIGHPGVVGSRGPSVIPDVPFRSGLIGGAGAGRTDRIPLKVPSDSHVWPADVVSSIGQGASINGAHILDAAMKTGPYGVPYPKAVRGRGPPSPPSLGAPRSGLAEGGEGGAETSILAASAEYISPPEDVQALGQRGLEAGLGKSGQSAMDLGHELIDNAIALTRKYAIAWLREAPPPKK